MLQAYAYQELIQYYGSPKSPVLMITFPERGSAATGRNPNTRKQVPGNCYSLY